MKCPMSANGKHKWVWIENAVLKSLKECIAGTHVTIKNCGKYKCAFCGLRKTGKALNERVPE